MLFFYFNHMQNIINNDSLVLGLMSGTSMDGLDISCARYYKNDEGWNFDLVACETFPYDDKIKINLFKAFSKEITLFDIENMFTQIMIDSIKFFLNTHRLDVDLISSHGHTIFHNPDTGYTKQIGLGNVISQKFNIPVVCDFRQQDIDLGGQGAPLVPVGDRLLFKEYDSCLNLGGIANISFDFSGSRYAYDICPCNMILNKLSKKLGQDFDKNGKIAKAGKVNKFLFNQLNKIDYYQLTYPKSLSKEYIDAHFDILIDKSCISTEDIMSTFVEHIAYQISNTFIIFNITNSLLSGGGTFNQYLVSRIEYFTKTNLILANPDIINFKEAIIFGFLGVLRIFNQANCLSSATGANRDHSSGKIYFP
jgi:anhydro-N-acetylmuramic acid kinase